MLIDATVSCTSRRENPKLDRGPDNENESEREDSIYYDSYEQINWVISEPININLPRNTNQSSFMVVY